MTRPRVPDDKRQRTAQACDICKRRKQKCNGKSPCLTCTKRQLKCEYTSHGSSDSGSINTVESPRKRRRTEKDLPMQVTVVTSQSTALSLSPTATTDCLLIPTGGESHGPSDISQRRDDRALDQFIRARARQDTSVELDEEAEVIGQTRMLQDSTGRLLYVGDSATLSYLQLIRMIVEIGAGSSQFTSDPNRHMILEASVTIPPSIHIPPILPDRETATILVNAFFTNTHGLVEVFDRRTFTQALDACYSNPLTVDAPYLCLVYLTLAIGLVLATPIPNSPEDIVIKRLRSDPVDRAEIFYRGAKCLGDPVSGFEDADFWSVQALCLMSIYMLAVSKRNAAYAYYGMAVRTAFALGLHRIGDTDTTVIFDNTQVAVRRNLWRSLFVLDRFLAASLGRPTAISEDDCSSDALESPHKMVHGHALVADANLSARSLDAAVKTCQSIGHILKKIYSRRRISTKMAQEIAGECELWTKRIHEDLDASKLFNGTITAAQGMAILHVQLLACHSIILLTRPFFLYLLIKIQKEKITPLLSQKSSSRLEWFSEACVAASTQTIALVQTAYHSKYLPERNPFVIYFLFTATLIILSNEFTCLYKNKHYAESVTDAINIMKYCATSDAQAQRLLFIVTSFRDVVEKQARSNEMRQRTRSMHMDMSEGNIADPLARLATPKPTLVEHQAKKTTPANLTGSSHAATSLPGPSTALTGPSILGPRTTAGQSEDPKAAAVPSPASSRTTSSQSHSGRNATDGDKTDSLGGEQEFDFDCFWDFQPLPNATNHVHNAMAEPRTSSMQQPGAVASYAHFLDFSTSADIRGQTSTAGVGSSVPLFSVVNYQG